MSSLISLGNSGIARLKKSALVIQQEHDRRRRSQDMAERATASFREYIPLAWASVEPSRPYLPNMAADAIAEHLQAVADGQIKKLLLTVFPGSAKSVITSVLWPSWMWTPKRNPGWRSTFASYEAGLSTRDSVRTRDLLRSVWYQETFQPDWTFASDQNEKTYYVNSAKGFRVSTSITGRGTGWRGHAIVADDPLNAKERNSPAALIEVIDWWTNTMFNRLDDMATGSKIIIMQRLTDRDLAGHVLREGGYEHVCIPMEYDPGRSKVTCIGWVDPRKEKGDLAFPQLFPQEVVDELKINEATYSAQYQQQPVSDSGSILKSHWWNYWQPPGMQLPPVRVKMPNGDIEERRAVEIPETFDFEIQSWDFPFKDLKDSDYAVGAAVGVRGANRYVRDMVRDRMDLPAALAAVRGLSARFPRTFTKLVEDKANGPAVIQSLRNEIPGLTEKNPGSDSKVGRAVAATPAIKSGNWYLPHPMLAPWLGNPEDPLSSGFLAETAAFPHAAHDDYVDVISQAELWLQEESAGRIFTVSERDVKIEPIQILEKWPRMYGFSSTWNETAAAWIARRPETGEHFVYACFSSPASDPAKHVAEIHKISDWAPGVMHAAEPGRSEKDGHALATRYRQFGLKDFTTVFYNEQAEIADLQEALRSGKLKIFADQGRLLDQFRMYRRDDRGKLPTHNAGIIAALLVVWKYRDKCKPPAEPAKARTLNYSLGGTGQGWMGT